MDNFKHKMIQAVHDSNELELLFQNNPVKFISNFQDVLDQYPDSPILQTWHERIAHTEQTNTNNLSLSQSSQEKLHIPAHAAQ